MSTAIGNFNTFSYGSISGSTAGSKLYVPVSKSSLLYSHFDHVSGVAAGRGQKGVSISKIQILNSLIERLSSIKNQPKESVSDISDDQADALIQQYQKQMQQAIQTPYILSGAQPMAGDLFSINI
ncbi:MAG: hypothetical protein MJ188_05775 [Treponema sp.]|nr:hypothetical protein [Treponema sp.]